MVFEMLLGRFLVTLSSIISYEEGGLLIFRIKKGLQKSAQSKMKGVVRPWRTLRYLNKLCLLVK